LVEELRQLFEQAGQQSPEVQHRIAELVKLGLEERDWDELIESPRGQAILEQLAADARAEIARGEVEEGGGE
jgi:hypothetical protein